MPVVYLGFALTGILTTLLGPILPFLAVQWSLSDARLGYCFTFQFLGSITGTIASGHLADRLGYRRLLALGFLLMSAGVAMLVRGGWATGLAAIFDYGVALGLTIPTTNFLIAEANPHRAAAALNTLNLAWGLGAVASPPTIAALAPLGRLGGVLLLLSLTLAMTGLWMARTTVVEAFNSPRSAGRVVAPAIRPWRNSATLWLGALLFLYVGAENAVAGWSATYTKRVAGGPETIWELAPTLFWAALLGGRALAPALLRYMTETSLILSGLVVAALGIGAILATGSLGGILVGVALSGAGLATIFPTAVAVFSERAGAGMAPRAGAPAFTLAALGGAIVPAGVGLLSTRVASLRAGMIVPLLATLAMIGLSAGPLRSPSKS